MIKDKLLQDTSFLKPQASNGGSSTSLFIERKRYNMQAFSSPELSVVPPINMWYDKLLYGRVDEKNRIVHLSESYLKRFPVDDKSLYCLNFVVDAYEKMIEEIKIYRGRGTFCQPFELPEAKVAWSSVHASYHKQMNDLYYAFKAYLSAEKLEKKITDFKSFLECFLFFVELYTPIYEFTRSKLVTGKNVGPLLSGLVFDIDDKYLYSEDLPKINEYIENPNFAVIKDIASRHGFLVDKHIPWRMVADIDSPPMASYMEKYGVTKQNLFEKYYYKSSNLDLEALKRYIIAFYNSYVTERPTITFNDGIGTRKVNRTTQTKEVLDKVYGDDFWLRMYLFIRAREENKAWDQLKFEKIAKNASLYNAIKNKEAALSYIDGKCRTYSNSSKRERNFVFTSEVCSF